MKGNERIETTKGDSLKQRFRNNLQLVRILFAIIVTSAFIILSASNYYRLAPSATIKTFVKYSASQMLRYLYSSDLRDNQEKYKNYWVGSQSFVVDKRNNVADSPFIYEVLDDPHLQALRQEFTLLDFLNSESNEYDAQLNLAAWLGTRWDHGTSSVKGGKEQRNPLKLIRNGENGAKYWCEIAAIVTVQTATALGWPARVVSLSRDGYTMEHAVAELWSNQFNKWFVVDTDFNVIFARQGIPLSAFELCHYGLVWQKQGQLDKIFFATAKPSLTYQDLLPYFRYVFVDLRNDWLSRDLRRGSPAGGNVATFWTAREDSGPLLTSAQRVDGREQFDWPVNQTWIKLVDLHNSGNLGKTVELAGYSPYYDHFELQLDDGTWQPLPLGTFSHQVPGTVKAIAARMITTFGHRGPPVYWQMP